MTHQRTISGLPNAEERIAIARKAAKARWSNPTVVSEVMAELGQRGGRARAESLTPEQRKAAGQHAIAARWSKGKP